MAVIFKIFNNINKEYTVKLGEKKLWTGDSYMRRLFIHKNTILMIICIVLQQILVCSSTLFIAILSRNVISGQAIIIWLILFLLSLFLAYIPSIGTNYFLNASIFESFKRYIQDFENTFSYHSELYSDLDLRKEKQPYLNQESWLVIDEFYKFVSDWLSVTLSVVFNVVMLVFIIDKLLIAAYIMAAILMVISIFITSKKISKASEKSQNSRTSMMYVLLSSWDNIFISNSYNLRLWNKSFSKEHTRAKEDQLKSTILVESTTTLSMFLSLIPVVACILFLIQQNEHDAALLIILITTLPRQISIIQYIGQIAWYSAQWQGMKARILGIQSALCLPEDCSKYIGNINWDKLRISIGQSEYKVSSIEEIMNLSNQYNPCRITIQGSNGSGKSTLLFRLKSLLKDSAYLLPTQSLLIFDQISDTKLSTGEKMISCLNEVEDNVTSKILLLDEWDANLDFTHISLISDRLEELAKEYCIIEVRHR